MPRPVKPRKVGFIPEQKLFIPQGSTFCDKNAILLKHEEIEAMRLKDIENLHQEQCASIMDVSRQTFQLIIDSARTKVASALINGHPIKIEGGNFIEAPCKRRCKSCGNIYNEQEHTCPNKGCKHHCSKCCHTNKP